MSKQILSSTPLTTSETKDKSKMTIIICVIIALLAIVACSFIVINGGKSNTPSIGTVTIDTTATDRDDSSASSNLLDGRNIELSGYFDMTVSKGDIIYLDNPKSNDDFYIKYAIRDANSDKVYFETDLIESGKGVNWNVDMEKGEYDINIVQMAYWKNPSSGEFQQLPGGSNAVKITVE